MYKPDENEGEVKAGQIPSKEQIRDGQETHDKASNGIASLPPYPVDHVRYPGTTKNGRESKQTHDDSYVCL